MNTAFIGLDYIHDIMVDGGKVARCAEHARQRGVIAAANQAIAEARRRGWLVVQVKVGFSPSYVEQAKNSPLFGRAHEFGALDLSGPGTAFHPDLDVRPEDAIVIKPRVSAFYATSLEAVLRAHRIERLILSGVSSTWAVQAAARDAHDRDYQVLVLEDGCAAASEEEHRTSMRQLETIARIIRLDELAAL
ncbi:MULTISPECIES: cysteine hydrolase family protein [Chromobacterium]|uniref:Cysteine hydrolase n=1 Tax=Chromobacterium rhizoryzae TaxID=1778675 RepID=A0AAD0RPL3_9NEIS|nr:MULTISPECIES: isochorismatase family cysteine hydrolase [Chromobacterium]AXT45921.1 cysteine hydrolase [Chromobacterium rhizoryzae]QOZ84837.1 cysteine hydrolase [Chromobacterium sp. Rain0013]WON85034.1 cysteine hydrolase [Chromobacterium haemolyticum]